MNLLWWNFYYLDRWLVKQRKNREGLCHVWRQSRAFRWAWSMKYKTRLPPARRYLQWSYLNGSGWKLKRKDIIFTENNTHESCLQLGVKIPRAQQYKVLKGDVGRNSQSKTKLEEDVGWKFLHCRCLGILKTFPPNRVRSPYSSQVCFLK